MGGALRRWDDNRAASKGRVDGFVNEDDEIKLDDSFTSRSKTRKIPGVGAVECYPSKAEKRAKAVPSREVAD